jgi:integrase
MRANNKFRLTERFVRTVKPTTRATPYWDTFVPGVVLMVQPTGFKSFKFFYSFRCRARWIDLGPIDLDNARKLAAQLRLEVVMGKDPLGERRAERGACTFGELYQRYLEEHAKVKNKSWRQADYLMTKNLLPHWADLDAKLITRADVRTAMGRIASASSADQALAAASAVFSWAVRQELVTLNPCQNIDKRTVAESRDRVLSDTEVKLFWDALDTVGLVRSSALKVLLLTGQRPGEVANMRKEHITDNVWTLPGKPDTDAGWPGTKNGVTHSVWLPEPVRAIIAELIDDDSPTGLVFTAENGSPVYGLSRAMIMISKKIGGKPVRPHDLRRTHGSTITKLGFGRDAMNRIQNHKEGGIATVYDRHQYFAENRTIMERVASHLMELAEGRVTDTVVALKPRNRH